LVLSFGPLACARLCPSLAAFHSATENTKMRGGKAGNNNARMWQGCQSAESFPASATAAATLATRLSTVCWPGQKHSVRTLHFAQQDAKRPATTTPKALGQSHRARAKTT